MINPLETNERSPVLDLIRGVAILGILPVNAAVFAMNAESHVSPWMYGEPGAADLGAFSLMFLFFQQKFYPIFAMLFGAGIFLAATRNEGRGVAAFGPFLRRHVVLLFLGLAHVALLWFGDVLFWYALLGGLVYLMRNVRTSVVLPTAIGLLIVPAMFLSLLSGIGILAEDSYGVNGVIVPATSEMVQEQRSVALGEKLMTYLSENGTPKARATEIAVYRYGSLLEIVALRLSTWVLSGLAYMLGTLWVILGYMLLGLLLVRHGWLWNPETHAGALWKLGLAGLVVGIPFAALSLWMVLGQSTLGFGFSFFPAHLGGLGLSLFYVAGLALAARSDMVVRLTAPLRACGRMALTNYLSQSLILAFLFHSYGFALEDVGYGSLYFVIVPGIWVAQLVWSPVWLRLFKQGPMEAVWRTLAGRGRPV